MGNFYPLTQPNFEATVPVSFARNWEIFVRPRGGSEDEEVQVYGDEEGATKLTQPLYTGPTGRIGEGEQFGWIEGSDLPVDLWGRPKGRDDIDWQVLPEGDQAIVVGGVVAEELKGKADLEDGKLKESQLPDSVVSDSTEIVNVERWPYNVKPGGTTVNTTALQTAIEDIEEASGKAKLLLPSHGPYLTGPLTIKGGGVAIEGAGRGAWLKAHEAGEYLVDFSANAEAEGITENHAMYNTLRNIKLDGNGRSLAVGGLRTQKQHAITVENVTLVNFLRQGWRCGLSTRESTLSDVYLRYCGGPSYPQMHIYDDGTVDGANNLSFFNLRSVFGAGTELCIEGDSTGLSTRQIWFFGGLIHGPVFTLPHTTDEGYIYENESEWRQGHPNVDIADARAIYFFGIRQNGQGQGFPHTRIRQGPAGASTINSVYVRGPAFGGPLLWEEMPVTASAEADTLTRTESKKLYLATGAVVRVTSSGELPGGLSKETDYWCIKVSDEAVKLATSRENAAGGTAINLTSAGSGTIKIVPRDHDVDLESGHASIESNIDSNATSDGLPHVVNRTGSNERLEGASTYGKTVHIAESKSAFPIQIQVDGESFPRLKIEAETGKVFWGNGAEEPTALLYSPSKGNARFPATTVRIDKTLVVGPEGNFSLESGAKFNGKNIPAAVTGSKAANAALESLIKKLAELGLIKDETT